MKLGHHLSRVPTPILVAMGVLLVAIIGILDYATGPEISVSILYLLPTCLVCWFAGRWLGVALALLSATTWLLAEVSVHGPYGHPVIPYWNTLVRLGFYLLAVFALSALETAYRRLQVSEALRDDMTNMLVHDLKNPLITASMARRQVTRMCEADASSDGQLAEMLDIMSRSHQRMEGLIADILDVARAEGDELPLSRAEGDLLTVVGESVAEAAALHEFEGLSIDEHYDDGPLPVAMDGGKIRRVVDNLLSNALRFTPKGGRVDVLAKRHGQEAWVTVRDTGKGIPRLFHRRIFDKFRQVEAQSGGHRLSVGLGLPFCKLVVEAHGGRIWVESAPGEGSAFTFTVPLGDDA